MKLFLGDLVHDWEKVSLWTVPLNVGFIGAYAKAEIPEVTEVRLFKRPDKMIEAIKRDKPEVIGLANYVWNTNLNNFVFDIAKRNVPGVLCVGGGPNFTTANADEAHVRRYFERVPACDLYVVNQGERGFAEILKRLVECNGDVSRVVDEPIPGVLGNALRGREQVWVGKSLDALRELDVIPSPYLTGMLDEFFSEPFVPIIETNRSCPYRCTFCAWGIGTGKLATFSTERVLAEIDYISEHHPKSANMFVCDANFSVLERDAEIARHLRATHERTGFPAHVGCQWNKSRPDRVVRVARELGDLGEIGASMQSLKPEVLDAIKRRNLPLEAVAEMVATLKKEGHNMTLFSELIVGLPFETWQSHIDANKQLIDVGAEVFNYNLHLLPGTEMDTPASRAAYFKRTGWRLHDNAYGIYDGAKIFEGQEVVLETNAMNMAELRSFRFIHFLIQFMWSRKWYYDFLHLFKVVGLHPIDMIVLIAKTFSEDTGEMGKLYQRFKTDHDLENFESAAALESFWSEEENFERLKSGDYGKLNYLYTYEILLDHFEEFNGFLFRVAQKAVDEKDLVVGNAEEFVETCGELLAFSQELRITLTQSHDSVVDRKRKSFSYDFLAWRDSGYDGPPVRLSTSDRFEYEFFLPNRQKAFLERQLAQFVSENINLTLRKMSEEINADEFFYRVRSVV